HVHVPRARAAMDSAATGIAIYVAVASLMLRFNTNPTVAVVGELTLRGAVLPVSGIKDMLLAAHRAGLKTVVIPAANERDLDDVPAEVVRDLDIKLVRNVSEVLAYALDPTPVPNDPLDDAEPDASMAVASSDSVGP
ncbi:MAG TPA: S16 family serine protease, partial [Polyangiaceae bacterium]